MSELVFQQHFFWTDMVLLLRIYSLRETKVCYLSPEGFNIVLKSFHWKSPLNFLYRKQNRRLRKPILKWFMNTLLESLINGNKTFLLHIFSQLFYKIYFCLWFTKDIVNLCYHEICDFLHLVYFSKIQSFPKCVPKPSVNYHRQP